jgi:hypothetical protein
MAGELQADDPKNRQGIVNALNKMQDSIKEWVICPTQRSMAATLIIIRYSSLVAIYL